GHSVGEISESEPKAGFVEISNERSGNNRLHLPNAGIFATVVAEILPSRMARADYPRNVYGDTLIAEQLSKGCSLSGIPVRVVALHIANDLAQLTSALGRCIADCMSNLMSKREKNQLGVEAKLVCFRVSDARKMLETYESDALSIDHKLAGIGSSDAY